MNKLSGSLWAVLLWLILNLTGCATSRSELDIAVPVSTTTALTSAKSVYVEAVADIRQYETKPKEPNIPSLDPSEAQDDAIRQRAVGRKRNAYGMGLGDILLRDGQSVPALVKSSVQEAFKQKGYRIIESKVGVDPETLSVLVRIDKFWSWMNPGFWSITLSTEISTSIDVETAGGKRQIITEAKSSDHFQTGAESNWMDVINVALKNYISKLSEQIE